MAASTTDTSPRFSLRSLLSSRKALVGGAVLAFFALLAVLGPSLAPHQADAFLTVPNQPPSAKHWLGTTGQGQDVFSQTIVGARGSLIMGFAVGAIVTLISALVGACAGFFRGIVDDALSLLMNIFLILPGLPLAVVIGAYLPASPVTIAAVLVITGWAWGARVVRAQTLALRERDFVAAAIVSGESRWGIIARDILPNMASLLVSNFIGATIYAIGAQVGLEFLGLGDVSIVTWGTNLYWAANNAALLTESWWTFIPTGLCLALVGMALALLNFAVDELSNPRLKAATQRHVMTAAQKGARHLTPIISPEARV